MEWEVKGRQGVCYHKCESQPRICFNEIKEHNIKLSALKISSRLDVISKGGKKGFASVVLSSELKPRAMVLSVHYSLRAFTACDKLGASP